MKNLVGIILLILIFCQGNLCAQQYDEAPSYAEDYAFVTQDGAWCSLIQGLSMWKIK